MFMLAPILAVVFLVLCWIFSDIEVRSKLIFTAFVGVCWVLWFLPDLWGLSFIVALILDGLLWFVTFGPSPSGRR